MHRLLVVLLLVASGVGAAASASTPTTIGPTGVGAVRLGLTKARAVAELSKLFGAPAAQGVNTGCGRRYSEVEWGDFVAEFRSTRFSGFRYLEHGYPLHTPGSPREPSPPKTVFPKLATSKGISLGSTLAQLRAAYGAIRFVGTDRWGTAGGLVFVDDGKPIAQPRLRHIIEIKVGTCGDF